MDTTPDESASAGILDGVWWVEVESQSTLFNTPTSRSQSPMNSTFLLLTAAAALGADEPKPAPAETPAVVAAPVVSAMPSPVVVQGTGCSGCGAAMPTWGAPAWSAPAACCDPCAAPQRMGLLARLRAKFAARSVACAPDPCAPACAPAPMPCAPAPMPCVPAPMPCAPAPVECCAPAPVSCGQPVFTGFTTSCSDPCERVGLLARLRAKFARGNSCCDATAAPLASACCGSSVANMPVGGCTSSYGTVLTPAATVPPTAVTPATPPAEMPKVEPKDDKPKTDDTKKDLSVSVPPLSVPLEDLHRVPTLGGTSGKY